MDPTINTTSTYSPDRPATRGEDVLLRGAFADNLCRDIVALPGVGLVVGLYGPWGSGKSTLLEYLSEGLEATKGVKVIRFNPWWFSGENILGVQFLGQLRSAIGFKGEKALDNVANLIGELGRVVSEVPDLSMSPYKVPLAWLSSLLLRKKEATSLKAEIDRKLLKYGGKIVVIIDDVDRLQPDQVRQLFSVVKAVADFPNVVYVLAMDKKQVASMLDRQGIDGRRYLEKIVQVPFEVPLPDKTLLLQMFTQKLDALLEGTDDSMFELEYWAKAYLDGIAPLIRTPRHVVRLVNALALTYPAFREEVNPIDFVALEAIRQFAPAAYEAVADGKDLFCPNPLSFERGAGASEFHARWREQTDPDVLPHVEQLLNLLFPYAIWDNLRNKGSSSATDQQRRVRRVCAEEAFPVYFQQQVPSGAVGRAEVSAAVLAIGDRSKFAAKLRDIMERSQSSGQRLVAAFLQGLVARVPDIPIENAKDVMATLADVGDDLVRADKRVGILDIDADILIGRILWRLLERLPKQGRAEHLRSAFAGGRALATIVREVAELGKQQGKLGDSGGPRDEWLVTEVELATLEAVAADRIEAFAAAGKLVVQLRLPLILYRWRDWRGDGPVREWVASVTATDDGLWRFLEGFIAERLYQSEGSYLGQVQPVLDLMSLTDFIDIGEVDRRLQRLPLSSTDKSKEIYKLYTAARAETNRG